MIKKFFWITYKVYVLVIFFLTLIPFYPIFFNLLAKEESWAESFKWQVRWGKVVRFLCGINLTVSGQENLPKPPYVIVANHASYIDTFLMYGIIPDFFVFIGMASLRKFPMFGRFFTSGQNISVDRSSTHNSVLAFKLAQEKLAKGYSVAIFPEGGIKPKAPYLSDFKNGAFRIAMNENAPIVPVVMFNTHIVLESNNLFGASGRPGVTPVHILKPRETSHLKQEDLISLRHEIWNAMNDELNSFYSKAQ